MILSAKNAGVEIIKHQTHIVEDEMSSEALSIKPGNSNNDIYSVMQQSALNEKEEFELMNFTKENGMIFLSTPFLEKHFTDLRGLKFQLTRLATVNVIIIH